MKMIAKLVSASFVFVGSVIVSAQPLAPTAQPAAATPAPPLTISAIGPKIVFETPVYDFGRVKAGEVIKHTYIFTNTGDDLLILTNVQPGCGCTAAGEWTKKVEPGKTGSIPIQLTTANNGGQMMKSITVTCNDKAQGVVTLQIKGTVWKPIDVNPSFAMINIPPDTETNIISKVHIVNNMEELVTLSPPELSNTNAFTATLITNTPGKDFHLIVTALAPYNQPSMQSQVTLKTSSTNMPTIALTAWANIQQAVTLNPVQLLIPTAPLVAKQTSPITIQNNGAKPLKVTEPAVDIKGVDVQLNETSPGKTFTVNLTFPEGLELKGGRGEFTAKTDHPRFPTIKVPISQMARPIAAPQPIPIAPQVVPLKPAGIPIAPPAPPAPPAPTVPASASTTKPSVQQ
jgi:hypothetical protein